MNRILVAEDEKDIQELLDNYLKEEGYLVTLAGDGMEAVTRFHEMEFALVLLDIMLPKIDGFAVCELIRRESDVPIIMLTALDSEDNQIKGLDLQADDYITKPFSMPVLLRKIAVLLRRTKGNKRQEILFYKELRMDMEGRHIFFGGEEIEFTQTEFDLLKVLLSNQGRVLTRQMLLDLVWGETYYGEERIVDTHIKNIRRKIGNDYIDTIRGVGYRIDRKNKE